MALIPLTHAAVADWLRGSGSVFAEAEATALIDTARTPEELHEMASRRATGQPLEHVVGWAKICGVRVAVEEGVFVPRARSELLVHAAVRLLAGHDGTQVVLDLCCGSGALGVAVAELAGGVELHSADASPAAVQCARGNVEPRSGRVYEGDLFEPVAADVRGRVDVIIANVPYVPTSEIAFLPSDFRDYEPPSALDGGDDGLSLARRVITQAREWLAPAGHLLFEVGDEQVSAAAAALTSADLDPRVVTSDELEATVMIGRNVTSGG